MAESDLAPSERGSISRLIDAVDRLTARLEQPAPIVPANGTSPVNWWDVVPELDGRLFPTTQQVQLHGGEFPPTVLQVQVMGDRLELSLLKGGGIPVWRRCLYTRR